MKICTVNGCDSKHLAKGLCTKHYSRVWRHGSTEDKRWAGENVSYNAMHTRVRKARGKASIHLCEHCGNQAMEWAYDHKCPNEKRSLKLDRRGGITTDRLMPYSTDLARYMPLCVPCHTSYDRRKTL